ncbi:hypothetical protein [uncultured Erythrobacter sp.]|uniref:hypothetical protein n=1 Tax=uncultured Erythrobacter sp. TaxID=263913 RepID=UPI002614F7F3|nr:hypothetical protein [uncultured Erythrobacter sp.]
MNQFPASDRPRLICVYNADTGLIRALIHAVHKQFHPETYPCSLCALTYGAVSMRGEWKRFWQALDHQVDFYHRDDFTEDFPELGTGGASGVVLPAILLSVAGEEPRVVISKGELDAMADVNELIARVIKALRYESVALRAAA